MTEAPAKPATATPPAAGDFIPDAIVRAFVNKQITFRELGIWLQQHKHPWWELVGLASRSGSGVGSTTKIYRTDVEMPVVGSTIAFRVEIEPLFNGDNLGAVQHHVTVSVNEDSVRQWFTKEFAARNLIAVINGDDDWDDEDDKDGDDGDLEPDEVEDEEEEVESPPSLAELRSAYVKQLAEHINAPTQWNQDVEAKRHETINTMLNNVSYLNTLIRRS